MRGAGPAQAELRGRPIDSCSAFAATASPRAYDVQPRTPAQAAAPAPTRAERSTAAAAAPLFAREGELLERLYRLRATTADGVLARARTLAQHGGDGAFSLDLDHSTGTGRMVIALMQDALAISGMPIPSKLVGEALS